MGLIGRIIRDMRAEYRRARFMTGYLARAGTMTEEELGRAFNFTEDSVIARGLRELLARLEDDLLEEAFQATGEKRSMVLARLEGAMEYFKIVEAYRMLRKEKHGQE